MKLLSDTQSRDIDMCKKIVVGIAGMPGSGKSIVTEVAQKMGCGLVVMGDEVRKEVKHRRLELAPENLGKVMLMLRKEEGPAVIAKRCVPKIKSAKENVIVVDGIRSLHEINEFKKHFKHFTLIAVHASPETRFQRLYKRKRSDDPKIWETFMERDLRELNVGLGSAIATADYMVVNEGTKTELEKRAYQVLKEIIKNESRNNILRGN